MAEPIIFVVDPDPDALAWVATALQRRFGADYRIMTDDAPSLAIRRLEQACTDGEHVARVMAAVASTDTTALEWLARVHDLCPWASRCALISYGDPHAYPVVRRALALGRFDAWLLKSLGDPEERLYPLVAEILGSWARTTRPRVPIVTIVGERWAHRIHELRDLFERASLPYEFCAHDADEERRRLEAVGHPGALPVSTISWSSALEMSMPGVFAVGDVRHGSPRNVAAAVADGAIAVRSVYEYLRELG